MAQRWQQALCKQDLGPILREQCHVAYLQSAPKPGALHLESEPQSISEVVLVGESQFCSLGCPCGKNMVYQSKTKVKGTRTRLSARASVLSAAVTILTLQQLRVLSQREIGFILALQN